MVAETHDGSGEDLRMCVAVKPLCGATAAASAQRGGVCACVDAELEPGVGGIVMRMASGKKGLIQNFTDDKGYF